MTRLAGARKWGAAPPEPDLPKGWVRNKDGTCLKWCPGCKEHRDIALFTNERAQVDGKRRYCMSCVRGYIKRKLTNKALKRREFHPYYQPDFNAYGSFRRHRQLTAPPPPVEPEDRP